MFFRTPNNHDTAAEALKGALFCKDESKAQQHMRDETDINVIVGKFRQTGMLPQIPIPPTYQTFGEVFDFQSAMNAIKNAQDSFMALPANIRSRFENDPARFVAYVDHCLEREDLDPLREMGLAVAKAVPELPEQGTPKEAAPAPKTPDEASKASKT